MSFLSPWLLLGLLAAAIPPLLHLIHRRKPRRLRFPALEFLRRSHRKTARRFRIKQLLLMLIRSLLMVALALALSRPFLRSEATPVLEAGAVNSTIFVLDAGYPMAYRLEGESLFERAQHQLDRLLDETPGQVGLVIAGGRVESPLSAPTGEKELLRRALKGKMPGLLPARRSEALLRAYELLADQPREGGRRVILLSTPAGLAGELPPPPSEESAIELLPFDISEGAPLPNRAILGLSLKPAPEMGAGQWRVDLRVGNFSNEAVERLPVQLEVDGLVQTRGFLNLEAGEIANKRFYSRLEATQAIPARLLIEGDALSLDDERPFWLQPAPRVKVLALNGAPRPNPQDDELFYLNHALSPRTTVGAQIQLSVTAVDALDEYSFEEFDLLILANVGRFPKARAKELIRFVQEGGGLLISMGDQVRRAEFNQLFGSLLPRTLRDLRQAGDAAAQLEARRHASLSHFDEDHPILRPFLKLERSSLARSRIHRYMLLDPAPDAQGHVVIGLNEGAPFLLTRVVGRGRVALLCGTLDRDWGDLPIRPDFLPLIQQTLRYLTRVAEVETEPVLLMQPASIPAEDPRVRRVLVEGPLGISQVVERPRDGAWEFRETSQPGHYRLRPDPPLPGLLQLPGFAVAVDTQSSDLRGPNRKENPQAAEAQGQLLAPGARQELWHAVLLSLFLLLLMEAALLYRRREGDAEASPGGPLKRA